MFIPEFPLSALDCVVVQRIYTPITGWMHFPQMVCCPVLVIGLIRICKI